MSSLQPMGSAAMRAVIQERDDALAQIEALRAQILEPRRAAPRTSEDGVSVVIPVFDDHQFLEQALASVVAQTVPPLEIIVINDGSGVAQTTAIKALAAKYGAEHYRVTNRSLPNARNAGLMLAKGHAFLPLDADDWIDERFIEVTLPLLDAGADVVQVGLQEHGEFRNGRYMPGYDMPLEHVTVDVLWQFNRLYYCALLRTRLMREIGGYHGMMTIGYEDWTGWIDLMKRGAKFVSAGEVLFNYRTREGTMLSRAEARRGEIVAEMRRHHQD